MTVLRLGVMSLLFLSGTASAQVRQAELFGTITDNSGAVLPGVAITVAHVATGQTRTTVSEGRGTYLLTALPVGVYEIRAELSGFTPVVVQNIRLQIGESAKIDVQMNVATLEETVTVSGEAPLVDPTRSDLAGRIDQTQVEELPLSGRDWMNLAALTPGVKSEAGGGQPTAGVGDSRMSKVFLDGASVQNLSTVAVDMQISKEVIGEFEVITNRFDAVMGRAGTAVVNAVSKSGTDSFHGSGFYYLRDDALTRTDPFLTEKPPYKNEQYGGTIGGPVVKGRTHFFASYERQVEPKTLVANTGFPIFDDPVDSTETRNLYFARLDHSITPNHRLNARGNFYTLTQPNQGVGGSTTLSSAAHADFTIQRYAVGLNSVVGSRFVNQLLVTFMDSLRQWTRLDEGPLHSFPSLGIGGPSAGIGREHPFYRFIRNDSSYVFQKAGQHSMKFGGEYQFGNVQGVFLSTTNGRFFYDQNPANLATCCAGVDQSQWDKSQFPVPTRYSVNLGDFSISSPNHILGAYLQDDWTLSPRLTLNLGLRYDVEVGSLANDQTGLAVEPNDNDINNIQPRLGFAWDLLGTGKTIVRGGGGLYYDQIFLNITFNQRRTNTGKQVSVTTFNTARDPNFANDPLAGRTFDDFLVQQGAINVQRVAPDTGQPSVWSWSLGVGHQLTSALALNVDYVGQRSTSMIRQRDANLLCCRPDGNALPIASGFFPELGGQVVGAGRPDQRFNSITEYLTNGISRYHGFQLGLNKRMRQGYQFGIAYLLSWNKDDHNGAFSTPNNMFNFADEYSVSLQDQRHHFIANWVARLPLGVDLAGIFAAGSGRPINPTTGGVDVNGDGNTAGDRPICGVDARFDPGCSLLGIPSGQRVPRNSLMTDPTMKVDVRVSRKFRVRDIEIDPGFEIFNLLNRKNYDPNAYNRSLSSPRFGTPGFSASLPYRPLQAQLGIRMSF